ncbi:acyl-CoA dehydrogenase C-terminal domain-containing protein [Beijerinckia indica]|uniref:3-methylmercaptopropionyl-CoA dehydrogenase n=1 Tax=Beijerinckia indica subsp. indica (strain ATCC 9039 / DSM 1715 / NCIMB 8712) TaxID=395963 RepID=B2ID65_BEII9|nr:acyl-CoA dehydrogenase C-terminal domain-containing protein [Beijerinckia indica]ACB96830.1 acyl-CoA dehydrogenase domain protein [Beijerinckia indica subsp. indica ATCC 9039]
MPDYQAPVDDMVYLLKEVFKADEVFAQLPEYSEINVDLARTVLEEAGRLCANVLRPINLSGDIEGCHLENGVVRTPKGFKEAYKAYVDGAWPGLSATPEFGGQGLPRTLQILVDEMLSGSNLSFGLIPGLSRGAAETIEAHATQELKEKYLPKMIEGIWTGAMALTEAQAGSDLGLLKATATPREDGSYTVSGSKIFISSGDQDLSENVIHLVLARLPGAPAGSRGISLFLCPKFLVNEDGSLGSRNNVNVGSLEHKMGIHAQPTCVMNYDDSQGWLVGEPNRGLNAMFTMMNAERLFVGVQGLGLAEASYQTAASYAKERKQGRTPGGKDTTSIIEHPDVRKMLLTILSFVEAARALTVFTALEMDKEKAHQDEATRKTASGLIALLTPVVKAAFTDFGFEATVLGQQVLGGHGYIREWGQEQFVRDARIAMIYEGTNGIQAQDLVVRKLILDDGAPVSTFFALISQTLSESASQPGAAAIAAKLGAALELLQNVTKKLQKGDFANATDQNAAATDYLRLFALVTFGWFWLRMALVTLAKGDGADARDKRKLTLAEFFTTRILPQTASLAEQIEAGSKTLLALEADAF